MSRNDIYKKGIVLALVTIFILTSLSSVYAGEVFNKVKSTKEHIGIDRSSIEESETDMMLSYACDSSEKTVSDKYSDMFGTHLLSGYQKIGDRFGNLSLLDDLFGRLRGVNLSDDSLDGFHHLKDRLNRILTLDDSDLDGDWDIVVPDDYLTIQDAVNNSATGDKIFIRNGTYYENILIKTDGIILHGENKYDTIIDGSGDGDVVHMRCDYVNISGFTIKGSGVVFAGVMLENSIGNLIQDNLIYDNYWGVSIKGYCHCNNITGNSIIENSEHGVCIMNICSGNIVYDNDISNNGRCGLSIDDVSRGNMISWNKFDNNIVGVNCSGVSDGNIFYLNCFLDNDLNAFDTSFDQWDVGEKGNFWNDYDGVDEDGDGIGDTPYLILGGKNQDDYPLVNLPLHNNHEMIMLEDRICSENEINDENAAQTFSGNMILVPDDFPTIQEAVDHASDGDVIHVGEGIYYEHIIVDKSVKIVGDDQEGTIVDGGKLEFNLSEYNESLDQYQIDRCGTAWGTWNNGEFAQSFVPWLGSINRVELRLKQIGGPDGLKVSIRNDLYGENLTSVYIPATEIPDKHSWVEFDFPDINVEVGHVYYIVWKPVGATDADNTFYWSFDFDNPYAAGESWHNYDRWEEFDEHDYPLIDFCFRTYGAILPWMNNHVFSVMADNVEISGFGIRNCSNGYSGIRVFGNHCNIYDNTISNCGGGIELWATQNNIIQNNHVTNCIWGVYLHRSHNCFIVENNMESNLYGIQIGISSIEINNNKINANSLTGILNIWSDNVKCTGNQILRNYDNGIQMFSSDYNEITNNYIGGNGHDGISLHKSTNNYINENTINSHDGYGVSFWFYSDNNLISNNELFSNDCAIYCQCLSRFITISNNTIKGTFSSTNDEGIDIYGEYIYVSGNTISRCDKGIVINERNCIISNNSIIGPEDGNCGIDCFMCHDIIITANEISGYIKQVPLPLAYGYGIQLYVCNNISINDNIISDNSVGIGSWSAKDMYFMAFVSLVAALLTILLLLLTSENLEQSIDMLLIFLLGFPLFIIAPLYTFSNDIRIRNNVISDNTVGISANNFHDFFIEKNTISNNEKIGLEVMCFSSNITIIDNTFLGVGRHASFRNSFFNHWYGNYWGRPRISPKPIFGKIGLVPWINYDFHPRLLPYDGEE